MERVCNYSSNVTLGDHIVHIKIVKDLTPTNFLLLLPLLSLSSVPYVWQKNFKIFYVPEESI